MFRDLLDLIHIIWRLFHLDVKDVRHANSDAGPAPILMRRKVFFIDLRKLTVLCHVNQFAGFAIDRQKRVQLDANTTPRLVVPGRQTEGCIPVIESR